MSSKLNMCRWIHKEEDSGNQDHKFSGVLDSEIRVEVSFLVGLFEELLKLKDGKENYSCDGHVPWSIKLVVSLLQAIKDHIKILPLRFLSNFHPNFLRTAKEIQF